VGDVVSRVGVGQPTVSKHLSVLRTVGVVSVRRCGKNRLYRLNAERLKPVHDWVKAYERYWTHQLDRIRTRAEEKARQRSAGASAPAEPSEANPQP
jgi:DNA-binding transcriptional ArsR family regulator